MLRPFFFFLRSLRCLCFFLDFRRCFCLSDEWCFRFRFCGFSGDVSTRSPSSPSITSPLPLLTSGESLQENDKQYHVKKAIPLTNEQIFIQFHVLRNRKYTKTMTIHVLYSFVCIVCGGLMVSALDSGGKTLYSHGASLHPGV